METKMTPDEIKTIILFHIMDCVLDDGIMYVAIDDDGGVYVYYNKPKRDVMQWYPSGRGCKDVNINIDYEKYGFSWTESLVKL